MQKVFSLQLVKLGAYPEVKELQEVLYADGSIDKEEAEFLFDLNDIVSGKENDSSWDTFFVVAISNFLLEDKNS